jgi:hypothetical protein
MDVPAVLPTRKPVEWTHGLPGALLALALGRRWFLAWCVHVAIDSITHDCGRERGGHAMRKWGWLP